MNNNSRNNENRSTINRNKRQLQQAKEKNENIHIPRYIRNQPWYYKDTPKEQEGKKPGNDDTSTAEGGEKSDYLVHHRQKAKGGALDIDNNSEPKIGMGIKDEFKLIRPQKMSVRDSHSLSFCRNCGEAGHKEKDCMEKPRKMQKLVPDLNSQKNNGTVLVRATDDDWDSRKDRWYGYSGKEYNELISKWERDKRNKIKGKDKSQTDETLWDTDEEIELMKLELYKDSVGSLKKDDADNSQLYRTSTRLREDKAAYLNDINSTESNYDPKSRLYKTETLGAVDEKSKMFRRHLTGEGLKLNELNQFARSHAKEMGIRDEIEDKEKVQHVLVANPTKYEYLKKKREQEETKQPKIVSIGDLEARKVDGTKQSEEQRNHLKDLYG
ncbi:mRNA splicing protein SLU7 [Saccharomyces cerevisiae S288C]|uniref:Pre-mRNA-splicing factor SLU7 n=1 Tax=Saccharomyces cerevisiae (strain ATCC 204508 / S288c) TaxID=559292 RepID=SLU7_YEAST|eukprot:NP_010373.3 mRNA splicing protein SLU7 [Saccharomyces cerevisiae S288C]